jgi:hypothetical protein
VADDMTVLFVDREPRRLERRRTPHRVRENADNRDESQSATRGHNARIVREHTRKVKRIAKEAS